MKYFHDVLRINPDIKETDIYKGMTLHLCGRYDEGMEIKNFRTEFAERFKEQPAEKG